MEAYEAVLCERLATERERRYRRRKRAGLLATDKWRFEKTGCVPAWRTFCVGEPNKRQMAALRRLKIAGLYEGRL
jgi:hypothetical protein